MPRSSNGLLLLLIANCTWLMARGGVNDGHPLCNGTTSNWPWLLCWDTTRGDKSYRCMWYTMEVLSGWPQEPRTPSQTCDDLHIDCESSYVCTVLLQYAGVGPEVSFGEDSDRAIAASCLRRQCPSQAALADAVIAGVPGSSCPHTHYMASNSSGQAAANVGGDSSEEQTTLDLSDLPPLPTEHGEMVVRPCATTTPDLSKLQHLRATTRPDLSAGVPYSQPLAEAGELGVGLPLAGVDELQHEEDSAKDATSSPLADNSIAISGNSSANTSEDVNISNDTVEMNTTGGYGQMSTPTILCVFIAAALLAFCACPAAMARGRRQSTAREMLLPPAKPSAGEGERDAVLEAAVDDAE